MESRLTHTAEKCIVNLVYISIKKLSI